MYKKLLIVVFCISTLLTTGQAESIPQSLVKRSILLSVLCANLSYCAAQKDSPSIISTPEDTIQAFGALLLIVMLAEVMRAQEQRR